MAMQLLHRNEAASTLILTWKGMNREQGDINPCFERNNMGVEPKIGVVLTPQNHQF